MTVTRRTLLTYGLSALASLPLVSLPELAGASLPRHHSVRTLKFYHMHTGEKLRATYFENGRYVPQALHHVNALFRDYRTGDVKHIDPRLLDVLHEVQTQLRSSEAFHIVSAYRSPATNAMLREHSHGVAKGSMHIQGKAVDIRLPGRDCRDIYQVALNLSAGGAGYYEASDFVHIDTGKVRHW